MANVLTETSGIGNTLDKGCSPQQLREYFNVLLGLYRSGEQYPVDLEDVWMLVYSEKSKAVRALKKAFVEGEDYVTVAPNGERTKGRFNAETMKVTYRLSIPCFEYFIAKKVREVFEVYRKVFRKIATGEVKAVPEAPRSSAELLLMYAQQMVENERRISLVEERQAEIESKVSEMAVRTKTDISYSTIVGFARRYGLEMPLQRASTLGRVARNLCEQYQLEMGTIPDPRFGTVRTYPDSVLYDTFEKYYPNMRFR